jgi:DegV family protein with EDD domain
MPRVAVVTDSTATVPATVAAEHGIRVVPMQVVVGAKDYQDGVDPEATPENIAAALKEFVPVSTSRPTPAAMLEVYERAAADGAEEIVSVHLSAEVSATYESALLAAKQAPVRVHAVDSRQIGAGTGYAALAAAEAAAAGADGAGAAAVARRLAEDTVTLFYVDTLEYLRRGGRVGAAAALLGSALAVKPILQIVDGRIAPLEKVRTAGKALARLEELAVASAADRPVAVTVSHLAALGRAQALADRLDERIAENLDDRTVQVCEVPAVVGAHVGPGLVGVTIAPVGAHR